MFIMLQNLYKLNWIILVNLTLSYINVPKMNVIIYEYAQTCVIEHLFILHNDYILRHSKLEMSKYIKLIALR